MNLDDRVLRAISSSGSASIGDIMRQVGVSYREALQAANRLVLKSKVRIVAIDGAVQVKSYELIEVQQPTTPSPAIEDQPPEVVQEQPTTPSPAIEYQSPGLTQDQPTTPSPAIEEDQPSQEIKRKSVESLLSALCPKTIDELMAELKLPFEVVKREIDEGIKKRQIRVVYERRTRLAESYLKMVATRV